jgi:hypothetical protein
MKGKSESNIQIHPSFTHQVVHGKEGIETLPLENKKDDKSDSHDEKIKSWRTGPKAYRRNLSLSPMFL